jgi:hypothetical protein
MAKTIITVTGATGAQGGGLARALLADPSGEFAVRAVTRKPDGDAARALASQGAEIVTADLDDVASLRRVFDGAYGAFCLTNYWEHMSPDKEIAQAKNLADASRASGVIHALWSTLEDTRQHVPLSDERMPTLHGPGPSQHATDAAKRSRSSRAAADNSGSRPDPEFICTPESSDGDWALARPCGG